MEKSENAVRSRLLEAGKEEFRDRGFLKASLRAICKKADVTTGALYFFFESKAALFEEIVEETVEDLKRLMGDFTDHELVHILVQMKFQGYCELLRGNCSREKLLEISRILQICSSQCLLAIEAELNRKH